jgi:uncharacterized protein YdiU (UPF0061 family)
MAKLQKYQEVSEMTQVQKEGKDREIWTVWLKKYQNRLRSENDESKERVNVMHKNNPSFILR